MYFVIIQQISMASVNTIDKLLLFLSFIFSSGTCRPITVQQWASAAHGSIRVHWIWCSVLQVVELDLVEGSRSGGMRQSTDRSDDTSWGTSRWPGHTSCHRTLTGQCTTTQASRGYLHTASPCPHNGLHTHTHTHTHNYLIQSTQIHSLSRMSWRVTRLIAGCALSHCHSAHNRQLLLAVLAVQSCLIWRRWNLDTATFS